MRVLAALLTGLSVYLSVALFLGVAPRVTLRREAATQVSKRQLWLLQAGSDLSPRQFGAGSAAVGVAAFVGLWALTGGWHLALVPAIAIGMWPRLYYARARSNRLSAVQEAWPDGIRDLLAHVTSGATLPKALEALATDGPPPLRFAFERFPLQVRMFGVIPALEIVKEELSDPTSDKVIEVLILAHEYGGELVQEVLRDLITAINEDLRTLEDIKVADFEQRIESWLVVIVPWAVLLYLATVPEQYRDFYASAQGRGVVLLGMLWTATGVLLLRWIGRQQREMRVLGGGATVTDDRGAAA
jgi:tight adherence protein B